jgi:hypothetical protein
MPKKAWWSKADDEMLRAIEGAARPAVKRYHALVAKRYARTTAEEKEMLELGKLLIKVERSYLGILGKNPIKKLIEGK